MPEQVIYIYFDSVGNNVVSKGLVSQTSKNLLKRTPTNVLVIGGAKTAGSYDKHTGFRIIKGQENVSQFLESGKGHPSRLGSWIDFTSVDMLHQLTPAEISEILYIGHAYNYLHSPFYYKLQNNYIYLSLPDNFTKIYYRYLEEFLDQFTEAMTMHMQQKVNEKKRFFQKETMIAPFLIPDMKELLPLFGEGICLSLRQMTIENNVYQVPIFITEDRLSKVDQFFDEKDAIATLSYDANEEQWQLDSRFE